MNGEFKAWGEFTRVEEQADGSLHVEGIASTPAVDTTGERILASAIERALPEYLRFPAVREQHDPQKAAGRALAMHVDGDGRTWITAKIVDPVTIAKVRTKVLTGFSVGGSVPPGGRSKTDPSVIERVKLREVSLVDSPANRDCVVTLFKADLGDDAPVSEAPASVPATADEALTKAVRERDHALAKAARLERENGDLLNRLHAVDLVKRATERKRAAAVAALHRAKEAADEAKRERDEAWAELAKRPKGYTRARPGAVPVEKSADNGTAPAPKPAATVQDEIKRAWQSPIQLRVGPGSD